MSEITEFEQRIMAAFARINSGVERFEKGESAALKEALEAERSVNAQLEERVRAIKTKQEQTLASLERQVASLQDSIGTLEGDVGRLKGVNAELRKNNAALRQAIADGVADKELVDASLQAELEGVKSAQASDRNELDGIIKDLETLIGENA
ncbi:hypothetical protein OU789_07770 [Halocynthiibacter sp. C4]|uniref:hypothetical protein n=1 Tax=Halocynthiibacter sp. C4 TaxID=2992758 RepID=UPI00237C329C|nr:hypothetical protein [Halocynthiibacter sp. C4]MDE0589816.1 hypothetical protein [Halocynthiibacter sp. C4]